MEEKKENPSEIRWVYITAGSKEQARQIGKALVLERLAACANIFDQMNSIYFWDGKLQEDLEAVLIVKTTRKHLERVFERVKSLHSYDIPCMVSLPVKEGYELFLQWIRNEVESV
jgi:periplasmic divalent cation tolerance protein